MLSVSYAGKNSGVLGVVPLELIAAMCWPIVPPPTVLKVVVTNEAAVTTFISWRMNGSVQLTLFSTLIVLVNTTVKIFYDPNCWCVRQLVCQSAGLLVFWIVC